MTKQQFGRSTKVQNPRIRAGYEWERNDCVVRAFSNYADISYETSWRFLNQLGRIPGKGFDTTILKTRIKLKDMKMQGMSLMKFVDLAQMLFPQDTFFVLTRNHALVVKEGRILDAGVPPNQIVSEVWRKQ